MTDVTIKRKPSEPKANVYSLAVQQLKTLIRVHHHHEEDDGHLARLVLALGDPYRYSYGMTSEVESKFFSTMQ